ncbi:MAG: hypothetical protein HC800_21190 [Phormidesmis sp. RL_2_1]|nr:hypothetical protein [Phormidesmis sp. RL_2_1]
MTTLTASLATDISLTSEALAKPLSHKIAQLAAYLSTRSEAGEFSGSVAIAHNGEAI